jgi:hypothetical protein
MVEGFPRSGNTYVVAWLALAQPSLRVASHVHHLAHVRRAQKLGVPALIVMRRPRDAVLSNLVFHPSADARRLVTEWIDFYDEAVLARPGTVMATFDDVTGDLPGVLERFARRTGLDLRTDDAPPTDEAVFELVQELGDRRFGEVPDTRVSRPTTARSVEQERAARAIDDPVNVPLLRDADARYVELAAERPGR